MKRLLFNYGSSHAYHASVSYNPELSEDRNNTLGNRTVWDKEMVVMDTMGFMMGCNIYKPPLDIKTAYGFRNMVKPPKTEL